MEKEFREESGVQTPEETKQALDEISAELETMDQTDGVFGEPMLEEDLDAVSGGAFPTLPELPYIYLTCKKCGKSFKYNWHTPQNSEHRQLELKNLPKMDPICARG